MIYADRRRIGACVRLCKRLRLFVRTFFMLAEDVRRIIFGPTDRKNAFLEEVFFFSF